jgi:hypothetical protein
MLLQQPPSRRVLWYATSKLLRVEAESMVPNLDPEQVRKLAGWGLTQNDRESPAFGCGPSLSSAGVSHHFYTLRRLVMRNPLERFHGKQSNPLVINDLWL